MIPLHETVNVRANIFRISLNMHSRGSDSMYKHIVTLRVWKLLFSRKLQIGASHPLELHIQHTVCSIWPWFQTHYLWCLFHLTHQSMALSVQPEKHTNVKLHLNLPHWVGFLFFQVFAFVRTDKANNSPPHSANCHVCECLLEFRTKVEVMI